MHAYDIYSDRKGQLKAVKSGFSWFGFFLCWLWTLIRGMYGIGIMQCLAWFVFLLFGLSFMLNLGWLYLIPLLSDLSLIGMWVFEVLGIACFLLMLVLHLYVGVFCNNWLRNKWNSRGFKRHRNILSSSRFSAIEAFKQEST